MIERSETSGSVLTPPEASPLPGPGIKTPVIEFKEAVLFPVPLKLEYKVVTSHFGETAKRIRDAVIQKRKREKEQTKLFRDQDLWHETIRGKLEGLNESNQFWNFTRCGKEQIIRTCKECKDQSQFSYACSLKWCPRCNWKITKRRQEILAKWIARIEQPKHLVTTQRNSTVLTGKLLRSLSKNLSRLRRSEVFENVSGGCVSIEITNENRGWHLHAHWLVDSRWVDAKELARTWGKLVGQDYAIVKVLDLRDRKEYQREVSKYVCKGSEMARWDGNEINEFIRAVRGRRFFFQFGSLFKQAAEIRREIAREKPNAECECGCNKFIFRTEADQIWYEASRKNRHRN